MKLMVLDWQQPGQPGLLRCAAPQRPRRNAHGRVRSLHRPKAGGGGEASTFSAAAFDRREPTFRGHKAYAGYKAQALVMPEELALQLPLVKELLDLLNIPRCELAATRPTIFGRTSMPGARQRVGTAPSSPGTRTASSSSPTG